MANNPAGFADLARKRRGSSPRLIGANRSEEALESGGKCRIRVLRRGREERAKLVAVGNEECGALRVLSQCLGEAVARWRVRGEGGGGGSDWWRFLLRLRHTPCEEVYRERGVGGARDDWGEDGTGSSCGVVLVRFY
ncbi:hypothetical protein NL676_001770 [Syzygium grande]|nr:hypothetical protein NL676_001770 [Syzygium grande]